jgi:hypothetical protein
LSYDLRVFSQQALDVHELRELLAAAGLASPESAGAGGSLTVTRGAKERYCFTLGLPAPVEAEDVPDEVTAVVLGATCVYELLVEGSAASEIPHAVRFARRLADASSGAVMDQQSGETWTRGKLRTPDRVERGTIDVVQLVWYTADGDTDGEAARAWLELARRHLPEALPRRFGPAEPLAMKLDEDGPDAFVAGAAAQARSLYFKASSPCIGGSVAGAATRAAVRSHSLTVHREPLKDPRWRDAVQRFFVAVAARTDAFFASAEVQRGLEWSGQSVAYSGRTDRTTYPAGGGRWAGLPPYPAWWSWFGPEYVPFVVGHLPADQVESVGHSLFHSRGDEPLDRDQLRSAGSPLPEELLATVDAKDAHYFNPPLTPAATMPPALRPSG